MMEAGDVDRADMSSRLRLQKNSAAKKKAEQQVYMCMAECVLSHAILNDVQACKRHRQLSRSRRMHIKPCLSLYKELHLGLQVTSHTVQYCTCIQVSGAAHSKGRGSFVYFDECTEQPEQNHCLPASILAICLALKIHAM